MKMKRGLTHKPEHFVVTNVFGERLIHVDWYRLSIKGLRQKMLNCAIFYDVDITLTSMITRNCWSVTPEGRWY